MKHTLEHLDRIAAEQAAYYGLTKEKHAEMTDEMARLCEEVTEDKEEVRTGHFMDDVIEYQKETGCDWSEALAWANVD